MTILKIYIHFWMIVLRENQAMKYAQQKGCEFNKTIQKEERIQDEK